MLSDFIKDILTGKDGESIDIGRVSWVLSSFAIIGFAALLVYLGKQVTLSEFGMTLSGNSVAHGAAIGVKAKTEPDA